MTALSGASQLPAWLTCTGCGSLLYGKRFRRELGVCPDCGWHSPLDAYDRLDALLDDESREVLQPRAVREDPLGFEDRVPYRERREQALDRTGLSSAVVVARGRVDGHPSIVAVMDFRYLGGSLGSAEGEAITAAAETALEEALPLVVVTASGGARMQEGVLSLMQMAKTSNAYQALDEAGLLTVTVVTDPTYGGVAASFATLSDVIVAEPRARLGFAGPRVIAQTVRETLPEGFQTAEHLFERGLVDVVCPRADLRTTLARLLGTSRLRSRPDVGEEPAAPAGDHPVLRRRPGDLDRLPGWDAVKRARDPDRPTALDHIAHLLEGFLELHGDRTGADCPALIGGIGRFEGRSVVVVAHQKGHDTPELVRRNFGMPGPAGYRKAHRLMRLADKLGIPVVTLIDTPGAHPGVEAEDGGQANAIADSLRVMGSLRVPTVAVVTGEGGSGGALALGVADTVIISENGTYSVISPEGCASILWRDATSAPRAAEALRIDARSLLEAEVVDAVVPEPDGGSQSDPEAASELLRRALLEALQPLVDRPTDDLVAARRSRFRAFGR